MDDDDDDRWGADVPTDVFSEILKHLPPISGRRRLRLVCWRWRDVVDEIEPEVQLSRAKPFAFSPNGYYEAPSVFVLDDLPGECDLRYLFGEEEDDDDDDWDKDRFAYNKDDMVGTCNGLVCMWRNRSTGRCLVVTNPATGDTLKIPPPPVETTRSYRTAQTLSFAYHPTTGKYKIVHLPSDGSLGVVEFLTLGDTATSWRKVQAAPGSALCDAWGVVSVDGATWVTGDGEIMSFDLEHERVAAVTRLPAMREKVFSFFPDDRCQLTEVGGSLWESPSPSTDETQPTSRCYTGEVFLLR